jgi:predicted nucleic acid-binding protein
MKRVVVDTHVLLASLLGGEARLVMRYWWEGEVALVLSEEMVEEYLAALARLGDTKEGARELVEAFGKRGKVVWVGAGREEGDTRQASFAEASEPPAPAPRTSRPEDGAPTGGAFPKRPALNKFVECAVAGKAEAIIAGDPDLVEKGGYKGIPILTPGEWLEGRFERRE